MRRFVVAMVALAVAALASGCARFENVDIKRSSASTVTMTFDVCEKGWPPTECRDGNGETARPVTAVVGVQVPESMTGPDSVTTTGDRVVVLRPNAADAANLAASRPPGAGRKWLAYRSDDFLSGDADFIPLRVRGVLELNLGTVTGTLNMTTTVSVLESHCTDVSQCLDDTKEMSFDLTGPAIDVTAPANGAVYAVGQDVKAAYTCTDAAQGKCMGPVASGEAIDTATAGAKTFTVQAQDTDGNPSAKTVAYEVAPAVELTGPATVDEGDTRTYAYTVAPASAAVTESCGSGGTLIDTEAANSFDCKFPAGPATTDVTVSATAAGVTASDELTVSAADVGPVYTLTGAATASEGQTKTYTWSASDPGGDDLPATTESCGTGAAYVDTPAAGSFDCHFPDGPATPKVSVASAAGPATSESLTVAVADVAPVYTLTGASKVDEGQTRTYTWSASDAGDDPAPATAESCGTDGTYVDTPAAGSFACTFPDGPSTSEVSVSSTEGPAASESMSVEIADVAPVYTLTGASKVDEGQTRTYTWSVSDPGDDVLPASTESCGTGGVRISTPAAGSFDCRFPDGPATSQVSVAATSSSRLRDEVAVTVANVAPAAAGDAFSVDEDGELRVAAPGVLVNDPDAGEDALVADVVDGPAHGKLSLSRDGGFTYAPSADFHGADSFRYTASDGDDAAAPVTVKLTVRAVGAPPVEQGKTSGEQTATQDPTKITAASQTPEPARATGFGSGGGPNVRTLFGRTVAPDGTLTARLTNDNEFAIAMRLSLQSVPVGTRARGAAVRRTTLATTTAGLAPGQSRTVKLRLTKAERALARRRGTRVLAVLKVRDAHRQMRRVTRTVSLRR